MQSEDLVSECEKYTADYIIAHADRVNWKEICVFTPIDVIEKVIDIFPEEINWNLISRHKKLSNEFLSKYTDQLNWDYISSSQALTQEIFDIHFRKMTLGFLVYNIYINNELKEYIKSRLILQIESQTIKTFEEAMDLYSKLEQAKVDGYQIVNDWVTINSYYEYSINKAIEKFSVISPNLKFESNKQ